MVSKEKVKTVKKITFLKIKKGRHNYFDPDGNPDVILRQKGAKGLVTFNAGEIIGCGNKDCLTFGAFGEKLLIAKTAPSDEDGYRIQGTNTFSFSARAILKAVKPGIYRATKEKKKFDGKTYHFFEPVELVHETMEKPMKGRSSKK